MSGIDYSKPLATLLREGTHEAHDAVAGSKGAKLLLSGSLARSEYVKYLMMLWHVYSALEEALDKHASHPALEPVYNPALLSRTSALSADIAFYLDTDEQTWQSHPIYRSLSTPSLPRPLIEFVSRIQYLSEESNDPAPLLAHAYVRYLGDLSGGQNMRHILAKGYGLDEAEGYGLSFYDFKELRSTKAAGLGEMKRIKEWYREGMNQAGEDAAVQKSKPAIVAEASTSFRLNAGLFETLQLISVQEESARKGKSVAAVQGGPTQGSGYPLSSVFAVFAAVCIAHFVLVVGGFTGNPGYLKFLAVEEWFANIWSRTSGSS